VGYLSWRFERANLPDHIFPVKAMMAVFIPMALDMTVILDLLQRDLSSFEVTSSATRHSQCHAGTDVQGTGHRQAVVETRT